MPTDDLKGASEVREALKKLVADINRLIITVMNFKIRNSKGVDLWDKLVEDAVHEGVVLPSISVCADVKGRVRVLRNDLFSFRFDKQVRFSSFCLKVDTDSKMVSLVFRNGRGATVEEVPLSRIDTYSVMFLKENLDTIRSSVKHLLDELEVLKNVYRRVLQIINIVGDVAELVGG